MKRLGRIIMVGSILVFWGCGHGEKADTKMKSEEIDEVTRIHNPASPLHPEKTVVLEEDLSIGGEDAEGDVILFSPQFYLADGTGRIWIGERQDQSFKVFDSDGNFLKTVGAKGDGPGEFQSLAYCGFTPDGRLVVSDFQARRTSLFDGEGNFLSDFKWRNMLSRLHLIKENSFVSDELIYEDRADEPRLYIRELDYEGKELRTYGEFTMPRPKSVRVGNVVMGMSIPQSPASVFAGDGQREWLYHCLNSSYSIEVFDADGKLFRVISRPYVLQPFTSEEKDEFRRRYDSSPNPEFQKLVRDMELPSFKTVTDRMLVDDQGNLWVVTKETRHNSGKIQTAVDVFNSEGRYEARIWLDFLPGLYKSGKIYRLYEDEETGYRTLKRYRVIWN